MDLMSNIVQELHDIGRSDKWIAQHLGMDKDEILRLKQLTGLMSLFKETQFSRAWRPVDDESGAAPAEKSEVQIELEETEEEM